MMKNKLVFLFSISSLLINSAYSQNWVDTLYSIETVENVSYGATIDFAGNEQTLYMDISHPIDDSIPSCGRPLLVMIHGGAWIAGDKAAGNPDKIRIDFAKRGYTTASINYRLGLLHTNQFINCNIPTWNCYNTTDSSEWYRANHRGIQDANGAIRYLVNNSDVYNIDPNNIFVVGESAGGFIAMGVGFMDDITEQLSSLTSSHTDAPAPNALYENPCIQSYNLAPSIADMNLSRPDLGSYKGTLHYPANSDYSIKGVGNFYGGAFNNVFQSYTSNPPALYLYHQPCDLIVPYNYGRLLSGFVNCASGFPTFCGYIINRSYSYGSLGIKRLIDTMAANSIPTTEYLFDATSNNYNCLQQATTPSLGCHAIDNYWLRTSNMATFFAAKIDSCAIMVAQTEQQADFGKINIHPNPVVANARIRITGMFSKDDQFLLFDINGRKYYEKIISTDLNQLEINPLRLKLSPGLYYLQIRNQYRMKTMKILILD